MSSGGCEIWVSGDAHGAVVLHAAGEIDIFTVSVLRDALASIEEAEHGSVVLDAADLEFVSAAALRVILEARERFAARGTRFVIRSARRIFRRLVEAAAVGDVLEFESGDDADDDLSGQFI